MLSQILHSSCLEIFLALSDNHAFSTLPTGLDPLFRDLRHLFTDAGDVSSCTRIQSSIHSSKH